MHGKRPVQELVLEVREATWRLAQELGRTPTESDLAKHLGVGEDELRQAQRAELAFQLYSLDAPLTGQAHVGSMADVLGEEDPQMEHMLGMRAVATHWGELPSREQKILLMDFCGGMTAGRRSASGSASPRCTSPGCAPARSATSARACSTWRERVPTPVRRWHPSCQRAVRL